MNFVKIKLFGIVDFCVFLCYSMFSDREKYKQKEFIMQMVLKTTTGNVVVMKKEQDNKGTYPSSDLEERFQKFVYSCMNDIQSYYENTLHIDPADFDIVDVDIYDDVNKKCYVSTIDVYDETKEPSDENWDRARVLTQAKLTTN